MAIHDRNYGDLRSLKVSPSKQSLLCLAIVFVILESSYLIIESYWSPLRSNSLIRVQTTSNLQWSTSPTLKDIIKKDAQESHPDYRCINIFVMSNMSRRHLDIYGSLLHSRVLSKPGNFPISRADVLFENFDLKHMRFHAHSRLIWIPQDDWLPSQVVHENVSLVLARTRRVLERLQDYRRRSKRDFTLVYTKQSRPDTYIRGSPKTYDEVLYVGSSDDNNIIPILDAWSKNPSWLNLTILSNVEQDFRRYQECKNSTGSSLTNVKFIRSFNEEEMEMYQNKISVHLLPRLVGRNSSYDMNMARSTASLILSMDIAPLNELINDESGVLIGKRKFGRVSYSNNDDSSRITTNEVILGVKKLLNMSVRERMVLGERARQRFLADERHFRSVMEALDTIICNGDKPFPFSFDLLTPYVH